MTFEVKCNNCLKELKINQYTFKKSLTKKFYCNHSCRATKTNQGRTHTDTTKLKIRQTLQVTRPRKVNICLICCNPVTSTANRKTCSRKCHIQSCKNSGSKGGLKASQSIFTKRGRSKNEVLFYKQIQQYFPLALHNKLMFGEYDADIIIEELKIAIHWNGPFHYRQIFSKDHYINIQKRDKLRYKAIQEAGYTNYIINDSNNRGFNTHKVKEEINIFLKKIALEGFEPSPRQSLPAYTV